MRENVRKAILEHLKAAGEIADAAVAKKRDLTDDEYAKVNDHMAKVRAMKKSVTDAAELAVEMSELNRAMGYGAPGSTYDAKAAGPGWGAKVVSQFSDGVRYKGLVGNATTLVTVPAPPAISMGVPASLIRQLVPSEESSGVYAYLRETSRVNNAAPVPQGGLKPTSLYGLTRIEGRCVTVAHLSEALNRADISDAPMLAAWVDGALRQGLEESIEDEIVNGDDSGERFDGLLHVAGSTPVAYVPGLSDGLGVIATCRRAITTLELLGYDVDGFLLNPVDFERAEMAATTSGELVLANAGAPVPIDPAARRLFGRPVVASVAVPAGTGIAAQFATATRLFVREEAIISISENVYDQNALGVGVGASDFSRNLVRARCEARMGLGILQPAAVAVMELSA